MTEEQFQSKRRKCRERIQFFSGRSNERTPTCYGYSKGDAVNNNNNNSATNNGGINAGRRTIFTSIVTADATAESMSKDLKKDMGALAAGLTHQTAEVPCFVV
jgi:hypothetical protein